MGIPVRTDLYFRVLGPLTVDRGGELLDIGGPQRRVVLAVLLARANETVSVDFLADALWDDAPPPSYRVQLQGLVSDLRRRLASVGDRAAAPIVTRAPGYVLYVADDRLDLAQFRAEVARARQARAAGEDATAARLLQTALGRWRGPAFAGLACPVVDPHAAAADELKAAALAEYIDAQMADGQVAGLSAELVRLATEYPLRERFHSQLMEVYARTGRSADALTVYRELRRRTVAELGIEPSEQVQRLHRHILGAEPDLAASGPDPQADASGAVSASAHRQLPPDIADFTGRRPELAALLEAGRNPHGTAVVIAAVEGMAGVGKTRLAVHAAHRLVAEGRYGDGQLYADLRGFSPGATPVAATAALESFLRLLGVPAERIPKSLASRSAVFRDRLAGQKVLILLDNAADEDQITPLLPASATCLVLVTSRRSLALEGARTLRLDVFSREEAVTLLRGVVGEDRVAAEADAAGELVARCGYLPLAIAVAARRLRGRPAWPIAHLVSRLADESRRLGELTTGRLGVEAVFALSYRALGPDRRQLFRMLGVHPGNDVTAASAAALAAVDPTEAERALESLLDEHLLEQAMPGRYQLHDLLRAYAATLSRTEDPVDEREAAISRLLDWYVHATDAATRQVRTFAVPVARQFPSSKAPWPDFTDPAGALAWLDAERVNLLAAVRLAASGPWYAHAVQLPHLLQPYLIKRSNVRDRITAQHLAESAADHLGDREARAHSVTDLGHAYNAAGHTDQAFAYLERALDLHRQHRDRRGEATTLNHLGSVCRRLGRHAEAADHYRAALGLFRALHDTTRQASTQSNLSVQLHLLGNNDEALDHAHQALNLQQRLDGPGEAGLRTNLGLMYARLGRHPEAVEHAQQALTLHRMAGSRPGEARALANLCFSYARMGRHDKAITTGEAALDVSRGLADPEIEATVLNSLGEAYYLAGDEHAALHRHQQALAVATAIGDAEERARADDGIANASAARPA